MQVLKAAAYTTALLIPLVMSSFCLAQTDQCPRFTTEPVSSCYADSPWLYHFDATDSTRGRVLYQISELPEWLTYDSAHNTLSGTPHIAGHYDVQILARTQDAAIRQRFILTIKDSETVNILCLGNSITNGTSNYNSYRRSLWHMLSTNGYNIDMVGSWNKNHMGEAVPEPDFDTDHEGHSGWTLHHMLAPPDWDSSRGNLEKWLKQYRADLVLLELGTNDVFQCRTVTDMLEDLRNILATLRAINNHIVVFIAQIPPLGSRWSGKKLCGNPHTYSESIRVFNKALAAFVKDQAILPTSLVLVDQYTGINPQHHMYDDIHPNGQGEVEMARRWLKALKPYLTKR